MALPLPYRIKQVIHMATSTNDSAPELPADAVSRLTEQMLHQFRILPVADQQHLLRVYQLLVQASADDNVITAGLIHDVGKACAKCRITVLDRGLHVILRRIAPSPYRRFAAMHSSPAWTRGLHRLANHAERGALAASQAGYNDDVINLVRHHESGGNRHDSRLEMLRRADNEAERR